jgi:hypothetical protein
MPPVVDHVGQRIPHLARCAERARVIPVVPDGPTAAERAVDGPGDTHREPLDAEREHVLRGAAERGAYGTEDGTVTEGGRQVPRPQRHVDGMTRHVVRARAMR